MTDEWTVRVRPSTTGWIKVPSRSSEAAIELWLAETIEEQRTRCGAQWRDEDAGEFEAMLRAAALERDEDKILDLLFVPLAHPVAVRVNVRVQPSASLSVWSDAGFELDSFDRAGIGPGVRCIAQSEAEIDGRQKRLIAVHFVFDDGTHQVQVEVEPTLLELYSLVALEVTDLVAGLEVRHSGGEPFASRPVPGYSLSAVDTFAGVTDG